MHITVSKPSSMDAKVTFDGQLDNAEGKTSIEMITAEPRRYSKTQRKVNMFPFSVKDGARVLDQGYISVDVRTGKLTVEHRNEEVPI